MDNSALSPITPATKAICELTPIRAPIWCFVCIQLWNRCSDFKGSPGRNVYANCKGSGSRAAKAPDRMVNIVTGVEKGRLPLSIPRRRQRLLLTDRGGEAHV